MTELSRGPPVPKQRTIFNIPKDDPKEEVVVVDGSNGVQRKTPPPRPPPPNRGTATPSPTTSLQDQSYVENVVYLDLDTFRSMDPILCVPQPNGLISPKTRPAPPPPPSIVPIGWNIPPSKPPPPPPPPPRPLPPLPSIPTQVIEAECSPSTSRCDSVEESIGSFDRVELADSFDVMEDDSIVADGHFICFAGYVTLQTDKKKKRTHGRLRNSRLSFYLHDEIDNSKPIVGPHNLNDLLYITFIGQNISIYFKQDDDVALIRFTPEDQFDNWILMLGESILADVDVLRGSLRGWNSLGRTWIRRGTVGEWKKALVAMYDHTLYSLETNDSLLITDLRKVHNLKFKVDKIDWCNEAKRKGQEGPVLLTLDGSSLAIEADFSICTREWKDAIEAILRRAQNSLETCRLTCNGIPVAVDKCITFISSHGLDVEGVYRKNGNKSKEKILLKQLVEDPWNVPLSFDSDESVFAVADVLRQFFRRLDTPLVPLNVHNELYALVTDRDNTSRDNRITLLLESLPEVYYLTLRKVINHLVEVTSHSDKNKATVDNLAKMFGPTLFCVDSCDMVEKQAEMGDQISVIVTLIHQFSSIFRETPREAASKSVIECFKKDMEKKCAKTRADGMLVPISLGQRDNRAFNVRVDLVADEVLTQAFALRDTERDDSISYGVFEVLCGSTLFRRLDGQEKISYIVLDRWLKWKVGGDAYLKVDKDDHPLSKNMMSPFTGKVKVALEGSRWFQSCELRIEGGSTIVMCALKSGKTIRKWEINEVVIFEGSTRKPGHDSALTFISVSWNGVIDKQTGICVHFKQEDARLRFHNSLLTLHSMDKPNLLVYF